MKDKVDEDFISKFDLLNSQENKSESEDIIWSDSSDYESNTSITKICQINYRKRKRISKKIPKKNSTLKLPFADVELNHNNVSSPISVRQILNINNKIKSASPIRENRSKIICSSPVLTEKVKQEFSSPILISKDKENCVSPILTPKLKTFSSQVKKQLFSPYSLDAQKETKRSTSMVLQVPKSVTPRLNRKLIADTEKNQTNCSTDNVVKKKNLFTSYNTESRKDTNKSTSPVLQVTRSVTPKLNRKLIAETDKNQVNYSTENIDKKNKLFNLYSTESQEDTNRSPSPVLHVQKSVTPKLDRKKIAEMEKNHITQCTTSTNIDKKQKLFSHYSTEFWKDTKSTPVIPKLKAETEKNQLSPSPDILDKSSNEVLTLKSDPLIEKVRSYFDCHKSSTPSQVSISECESDKTSKSKDDIEIVNSLETKPVTVLKVGSSDSCEDFYKQKKVRYKKDGLAYRLNSLLKKQKASTSLWYHERYLAANTNFILPNESSIIFRIKNVSCKFGCYLIELVDINNDVFFILLNNFQIINSLEQGAVFKLYRPYSVIDCRDCKLILNVSKYECEILKNSDC